MRALLIGAVESSRDLITHLLKPYGCDPIVSWPPTPDLSEVLGLIDKEPESAIWIITTGRLDYTIEQAEAIVQHIVEKFPEANVIVSVETPEKTNLLRGRLQDQHLQAFVSAILLSDIKSWDKALKTSIARFSTPCLF